MFYRSRNVYSILAFLSIFIILISGCSSPRIGLKLGVGETKVYESAKSYEDQDYDEWRDSRPSENRTNWSPTGEETNAALYPILTYLPEGNFGLAFEISPIWIGANTFSEDGEGVESDNASQFIAQGISGTLGIVFNFDIPAGWAVERTGNIHVSLEYSRGGGQANVILNKCAEGESCLEDSGNNKLENILNETIKDIEVETLKISLQTDREYADKSIGFALADYEIMEVSSKTIRMKASNKKEYIIKDTTLGFKFVWGKLF